MADDAGPPRSQSGEPQPVTGCLVRMGWLVGGIMLLTPLATLISLGQRWRLTAKDAAFCLILVVVVALRYIDWKRFSPTTADGEPATRREVQRNAAWLVGGWVALWALAQTLELG